MTKEERELLIATANAVAEMVVEGNVKRHTMTRLDSFVRGTAGKRLTYKGLIA